MAVEETNSEIQTTTPVTGQAGEQLLRLTPEAYGDGISSMAGEDRSDPRTISNAIFDQDAAEGNSVNASNFLWMWGQFIDHDLSLSQNGLVDDDAAPMPVPTGDPEFDPIGSGEAQINFTRSEYDKSTGTDIDNPRQQLNDITAAIDASNVYGSDPERMAALRNEDGTLKTTEGDLLPLNVDNLPNAPSTDASLYLAGDERANENVALLSLHTLFMREHNRIVEEMKTANPDMTGDELFAAARQIVEAQIQTITYNEFLPKLLGDEGMAEYQGHDADVDIQIANVFSTAAFRVGHTMLSSTVSRTNEDGSESEFGDLALRDAFFRPDRIATEGGIDDILRGAASSESEEIDAEIIDDVRNFLFGPPGAGGFDLASLNIQRGRDHGLSDYNTVREAYGLPKAESFADITSNLDLQQRLESVYDDIDDVDVFVAGLAEDKAPGAMVGELFSTIISEQFGRTRDGDATWFANELDANTAAIVANTTLADIIARNSDVETIQDDVFEDYTREMGTDEQDIIVAEEDNLLVMGGDGDDFLMGHSSETAADQLEGGNGNDGLYGNAGDDIVSGGDGDDEVMGESGNDTLRGGNGNDFLVGGEGDDSMDGGAGDDTFLGGEGSDTYSVSAGGDVILGFSTARDTLDYSLRSDISGISDLEFRQYDDGLHILEDDGNFIWLDGVLDQNELKLQFASDLFPFAQSATAANDNFVTDIDPLLDLTLNVAEPEPVLDEAEAG